eukprot:SAG31_NODE_449_length_15539_cov_21.936658_17_plen_149_part_00
MRKDKILDLAKGFRGRSKNCITAARARVEKGLQYQYRDRRTKKREFRSMWITRINAGAREHDYTYSQFTHFQNQAGIVLNRKILAELAVYEPFSFKSVVDVAKASQASSTETAGLLRARLDVEKLSFSQLTIAADDSEDKQTSNQRLH